MKNVWIKFTKLDRAGMYSLCNKTTGLEVVINSGSPLDFCLYSARQLAKVLDCDLVINGEEDNGELEHRTFRWSYPATKIS